MSIKMLARIMGAAAGGILTFFLSGYVMTRKKIGAKGTISSVRYHECKSNPLSAAEEIT